jgi:hypothetical protein
MDGFEPSKFGPEHDEEPHRRRACNRRRAVTVPENRDLTEEVARPERSQALPSGHHSRGSVGQDEKRVTGGALADQPHSFPRVLDMEPVGEFRQLIGVERAEEWDLLELCHASHRTTLPTPVSKMSVRHQIVTTVDDANEPSIPTKELN